jgi:hypothetical protein
MSALPPKADVGNVVAICPLMTQSGHDGAAPVASMSPDRTGVCRESWGAPSVPGLFSELGFRSPNRPDKGRDLTDRAGSRRELWCERPSRSHRRQLGGAIWGISVYGIDANS